MDRLFLDANVLFSAAYQVRAGLLQLWKLNNTRLCSSHYALEEARVNLEEEARRKRLVRLARALEMFDALPERLPQGISLPQKDAPIMLAAMAARATHLITGDVRHFGTYFGMKIAGILIVPPGDYLRQRAGKR